MQSLNRCLLFFVALCLFAGCKKPDNRLEEIPNKLKRTIFSRPGLQGKTIQDFSYDSYDRVTKIDMYFRGDLGDSLTIKHLDFQYLSAGHRFPSTIIEFEVGGNFIHNLVYDERNRVLTDNISQMFSPNNIQSIVTFQYSGNFRIGNYPRSAGVVSDSRDSTFIVNENILSQKIEFNTSGWNPSDTLSREFEYDNKINPLYRLNIASVYHIVDLYTLNIGHNALMPGKNNLVRSIWKGHQVPHVLETINYEYNSLDMPVKSIQMINSEAQTIEYVYQ